MLFVDDAQRSWWSLSSSIIVATHNLQKRIGGTSHWSWRKTKRLLYIIYIIICYMQIYAAMRAMHLKQETSPNIMTESVGSRWYLQAAKVRQKCDKWFAGWQNTPWVACWFISKYVQICRSTGWVAHGATLETAMQLRLALRRENLVLSQRELSQAMALFANQRLQPSRSLIFTILQERNLM